MTAVLLGKATGVGGAALVGVLGLSCWLATGVLSTMPEPASASSPPLPEGELARADPDPLELARVVAQHGDAAVLALLDPGLPVATQMLALRAAPWLGASWDALPKVVSLLRSRDSELAPAAGKSLLAIVRGLDAARLDRAEVRRAPLCGLRAGLRAAAADEAVRKDVRLSAGVAVHVLDELCGVPAAEASDDS